MTRHDGREPGLGLTETQGWSWLPYPFGSPFVASFVNRHLLAAYFAVMSVGWMLPPSGPLGGDARIYFRAALAFGSGSDPWSAFLTAPDGIHVWHFAALPTALFAYLPFTVFSEDTAVLIWLLINAASAVYIVRRFRLSTAWCLFPPLVIGVWSGNPSILLAALLFSERPWAGALAAFLKVYAVIPMVGQRAWRGLALAAVATGISVVVAPNTWLYYAQHFLQISTRLTFDSDGGTGATFAPWAPILIPATLLGLGVVLWLDRRAFWWLVIPALWPAAEFHYTVLAIPVMTPLLAFPLATLQQGAAPFAVVCYALGLQVARVRRLRATRLRAEEGNPARVSHSVAE